MKKRFLNLLIAAVALATLGFVMDGDSKEPMLLMRFLEFFGMIGILFVVLSTVFVTSNFVWKSVKTAR